MLGYLREHSSKCKGKDSVTGLIRSGLDEYLKVIFPETTDWVLDKTIPNSKSKRRPDYRSESLNLIIEFDGLPHYQNPEKCFTDEQTKCFYETLGYKVIRIPYFIQLTKNVIKTLFNKEVNEEDVFPSGNYPSLTGSCTPAYLCPLGIERMRDEFKQFPEQLRINLTYLEKLPVPELSGIDYLLDKIDLRDII